MLQLFDTVVETSHAIGSNSFFGELMVDHSFAKVHTLKRTATRGVHYEDGVPQEGGLATRHPSSNKPISLRLDQEKMTYLCTSSS